MAEKDSLNIDPIKNGFSQLNKKAPESVWNSLEENLSLNNDEYAISKAFSTLDRKAPVASWQKVKRQLIIDQVWQNIDAELSKKKRRVFWIYFSGLGVILFAFFIAFMNSDNGRQIKSENSNELISRTDPTTESNKNVELEYSSDTSSLPIFTATNSDLKSETTQSKFKEFKSDKSKINQAWIETVVLPAKENEREENPVSLNIYEYEVLAAICPGQTNSLSNRSFDPLKKHEPKFKKYELGVVSGIDNTWIFNNDVRSGMNKYSLVDNKFSLGYHLGLNFYFNLDEKSAVGFQTDFISRMNQRYDYFEQGNIYTNNLSITQQKFGLVYRYTTDRILSNSQAFVFNTGAYFARTSKSEFFVKEQTSSDFTFTKYDFGIRAAIGSQYYWKNLIFEFGLQSDIGLLNIAESPNYSAKKFNYTTAYLTGFYFSLRYSF